MGQATRTTKLFLDLENRAEGGANSGKRASLEETARLLDTARADLMWPFSWPMLTNL
jgi:hypothetical protein